MGRYKGDPLTRYDINESGCWIWNGASSQTRSGRYGRIRFGSKIGYAHVYFYTQLIGLIPDSMELDHKCRNTLCCNPNHLEPVSHKENIDRSIPFWSEETKLRMLEGAIKGSKHRRR